MKEPPNNSRRDAQRAIDGLADLFDSLASTDRAVAEEELRELGLDPSAVGRELQRAAEDGVAKTMGAVSGRTSARRLRDASPRRTSAAERHGNPNQAARQPRYTYALSLAVTLLIGVAIGALWMRTSDDRLAQPAEQLATKQEDADRLPPGLRVPPGPGAVVARKEAVPPVCGPGRPGPDPRTGRCADAPVARPDDAGQPRAEPVAAAAGRPAGEPAAEQAPPPEPTVAGSDALAKKDSEAVTGLPVAPWILGANNWQLGKDLLPAVVLDRVKNGEYFFRVVDADPEKLKRSYSSRFWEASAANAGKYDIDAATCGLIDVATGKVPDFYFGYPFPRIDPNDPQAACKMAWNFEAASSMGEGQCATYSLSGVDRSGEFKRIRFWRHSMSYQGRHGGPIENPEHLRWVSMASMIDPDDVDGVAGLTKRFNDWTTPDQAWFYVPATRRVRRGNAANRSDPIAGLDAYNDDINCYGGKIEDHHWKLIGDGNILAPMLSPYPLPQKQVGPTRWEVSMPYFKGAYETPGTKGVPWLIVDNLVMVPRPVWILEAKSDDPYYNFGKVIMYMDKDLFRIYWKMVYNRAGQYFYNAMCAHHTSRNDEGTFGAVAQDLTVGVNDHTNRAALVRASSSFIERHIDKDEFTLHFLTAMSD